MSDDKTKNDAAETQDENKKPTDQEKSAQAMQQELFVTINNHEIKSSGAGLMVSMFKKLAEKVTGEAKEELKKPKYRFFKYNFPEEEVVDVYNNLYERYNVKVCNDNVFNNNSRYVIKLFKEKCMIIVYKDGIVTKKTYAEDKNFKPVEFDFEAYKSVTRDYSFDDIKFWQEKIEEQGEDNTEVANACAVNIKEYLDKLTGSRTWLTYKEYLEEKLSEKKYTVVIFENIEAKNIDIEQRYLIRLYKGDIFTDYSLVKYREQIRDFDFDEEEFWEEKIGKLLGGNNSESAEYAKIVAEYLSHLMYFREFYSLIYKEIGWDKYTWDDEEWIFKYDELFTRKMLVSGFLVGDAEGLIETSENSLEDKLKWLKQAIDIMNNNPASALLIGAGVSGMLRSKLPYTKETNININIFGGPASGKSTIGHFILSIFGNPMFIEGSFSDTENRMEENRIKRPILPYVLDERMLKHVGTSDKTKVANIIMDIFREYEGKVKERVGKQFDEYSGKRTFGPVISSSVKSILEQIYGSEDDLGQYRRFIELNVDKADDVNKYKLFTDEDEAKRTETYAYKYYGFGVRMMAEYMLHLLNDRLFKYKHDRQKELMKENPELDLFTDVLLNRFEELDDTIAKRLAIEENEKTGKLTASSKRFALIVLSYQIFCESLLYFIYNETFDEIKQNEKASEELRDLVVHIIDEKKDKDTKGNEKELFIDKGLDRFIKESNLIKNNTDEIIDILTKNLVRKMYKVDSSKKLHNNLYDWVIDNLDKFYETKIQKTAWDKKELDAYIGKYMDKDGRISIFTHNDFDLPSLLLLEEIPSGEIIHQYVKLCVQEKEGKIEAGEAEKFLLKKGIKKADASHIKNFKEANDKWIIKDGSYIFFNNEAEKCRYDLISFPKYKVTGEIDEDKENKVSTVGKKGTQVKKEKQVRTK